MLFSLHIRNIALLDDVQIEFNNGFNVLSGETGAGKSILISSINLLLGDRANRELIRHGADRAEVSGLFYVDNAQLRAYLTELGAEIDEDGALLISRQLLRDGKNICRIGSRPATLAELKTIGQLLVNIHGQLDNQALLNPGEHIHFLDSFLKDEGKTALPAYTEAYQNWRNLSKQALSMDMDEAEHLRKIDMLSFEVDEIRSANLDPDEEEDLKRRRDVINHRRQLEKNVGQAISVLCDSMDGQDARQALAIAAESLESAAALDGELAPLSDALFSILDETDEVSKSLRHYFDRLSDEDLPIDEIEARLDLIYRLKRKYGKTVSEVLAHADACEEELTTLQTMEAQKEQMALLVKEAEQKAADCAAQLTFLRQKAIPAVESAITETLHFLNMPDADFRVELTNIPLSRFGAEEISFMITTNSGDELRPLAKIVSGGELSRIMLAIKSVLTDGDSTDTLIFDEIDAGVSGIAAQKIGRKLKSLAAGKQVLCVTHLAQIAAMADTHFLIKKDSVDGHTKTEVVPLSHSERIQELARIISGETVTATTLKQAEELIAFGKDNG